MTNSSLIPCPILANKADKKSILRFYKNNRYSASFIGDDNCYLIKENSKIIASVIISLTGNRPEILPIRRDNNLTKSPVKPQYLLHALLVDLSRRKLSHAQILLKHSITHHQPLVCFAHITLRQLYLKNGFILIADDLVSKCLNPSLFSRFQQYSKQKTGLNVFINFASIK